jgi:DNA-directed RNA polymerase subunit RPC12/RpoP
MTVISCPECRARTRPGGFRVWQIVCSIILFPVGLLALLAGRKPAECPSCHFRFLS